MKKIVIIGGGFGGIYTCKYLLKKLKNRRDVEINLINKNNYFVFTPMLHEVATGGLNMHSSIEPIREILRAKNFKFIRDEVKEVDLKKKLVYFGSKTIAYDFLVIAIGAKSNFFNTPGVEKYALTLKSLDDAAKIRKKIIQTLEESVNVTDKNKIKELLTFVIVGAGPTGVELVAEIEEFIDQNLKYNYSINKEYINILIVQKGSNILPKLDDYCIKLTQKRLESKGIKILLNSNVTKVEEDYILINDKNKIYTKNIIWTAGITPNIIKTTPKLIDEKNYIHVNEYLQIENFEQEFSLGDCALFFDKEKKEYAPALAQVAVKQAKIVANNIIAKMYSKPLKEFKLELKGFLLSVGQGFGVANLFGRHFTGLFAWFLWRTIYLNKVIGIKNKIRVGIDWALNLLFRRDTNEI